MTKKIGLIRKKFLTRERLMLIVEYLVRNEKQKNWTLAQETRWLSFMSKYDIDGIWQRLRYRTWEPKPFIVFDKQEGHKVRRIYESDPDDLVVDTLLLDCLNYVFLEQKHIVPSTCYGSIAGKGQHELRAEIIRLVHGRSDLFAFVGDTSKYYPTIDQDVLMNTFRQHIKDEWLLWLCEKCITRIEGMKGIALGLPSSNPIGHIYHSIIDWFVVLTMKVRRYYRFCDDKWAFHRDVNYLHTVAREIREKTSCELHQTMKHNWRIVYCKEERFECLGAMVNSHNARLKSYSRRRIERNIKKRICEADQKKALRTWGGIKGSLVNLSVSNLICYWQEVYPEFFRLCYLERHELAYQRRRKKWHTKMEKNLIYAIDKRSEENKIKYPYYGLIDITQRKTA